MLHIEVSAGDVLTLITERPQSIEELYEHAMRALGRYRHRVEPGDVMIMIERECRYLFEEKLIRARKVRKATRFVLTDDGAVIKSLLCDETDIGEDYYPPEPYDFTEVEYEKERP